MGINRLAVIWGLAEATVFFIVPDVLLSYAGRDDLRKGFTACLYSLIGALIGGLIMYFLGVWHPHEAMLYLDYVPAINPVMIENVNNQLTNKGLAAIFLGPLSGTPYKIYAVQSGGQGLSFWLFMLISIPARFVRFVLVTIFFHYLLRASAHVLGNQYRLGILIFSWLVFYATYFYVLGF